MSAVAREAPAVATQLDAPLATKLALVRRTLGDLGSVLVAFSGGVDSSLLAALAHEVLADRAVLCTAVSPSLAGEELEGARRVAAFIGAPIRLVPTHEVELEAYAANPPNRCYVCKGEVFARLREVADREGLRALVYGANADDAGDVRPGATAAVEAGVRAPLAEAGLTKAEVRAAARALGLPNWDKPAAPCLATRVPFGQRVTVEKMRRIEAAEALLHRLGFRECRVRDHGEMARLEIPLERSPEMFAEPARGEIVAALRELGFIYVTLDLRGLRTGSMNEALAAAGAAHLPAVAPAAEGRRP